jgi:hypothetical protein
MSSSAVWRAHPRRWMRALNVSGEAIAKTMSVTWSAVNPGRHVPGPLERGALARLLAAGLPRRGRVRSILARMLAREEVLDLCHAVAGTLSDGQ